MRSVKNIRLKHYGCKSDGYYFVTIVTNYRQNILDKNVDVVAQFIGRLNNMTDVSVDYFVIMPNHIHLILFFDNSPSTLSEIVRRFKAWISHELKMSVWQPNYYEHVIRNEKALSKIREYVQNNPEIEKINWNEFYEISPDKSGNYKSKINLKNSLFSLLVFILFFGAVIVRADFLQTLESGNFSEIEKTIQESRNKGENSKVQYCLALKKFYQGDLQEAYGALLTDISLKESDWLKNYLNEVIPLQSDMESVESEHFTLKTVRRDKFLSADALNALEKAYREIGADLNCFPEEKLMVEIYPSQEIFSKASTLSKEILDRSGAIGICKFRRLMILSPEQLAFGYRWLDTLSHEYTHYLINIVSGGKCPLWLHEGIAKYLDTRWRLKVPDYMTPGNRTELARALKENQIIPFSRMEPSMVYLDNQTQVRLAFSEVSHAVYFMESMKKREGIRKVLEELAAGRSREDAFKTVFNLTMKGFEERWKNFLEKENLEESPGSMPDVYKLSNTTNEFDEFVGTNIRGHIRLGDRFRQNGQLTVALLQYEKALKKEPNNPVALIKAARTLIALNRIEEAISYLEKSIRENPNYASAFLLLGELMIQKQNWDLAFRYYQEANAINPYNPEIHQKLAEIYKALGQEEKSSLEFSIFSELHSR